MCPRWSIWSSVTALWCVTVRGEVVVSSMRRSWRSGARTRNSRRRRTVASGGDAGTLLRLLRVLVGALLLEGAGRLLGVLVLRGLVAHGEAPLARWSVADRSAQDVESAGRRDSGAAGG